jgi:serine/threonine-protein kinase
MGSQTADREVLFGLLAVKMDLLDAERLRPALEDWDRQRERTLGELLVERGAMSESRRRLLEPLVEEHVRRHGGDPAASLAAVADSSGGAAALRALEDSAIWSGLTRLGSGMASTQAVEGEARGEASRGRPSGPRFRVLRPHARGGLGEVYVARDEELGRRVALKEIRADRADDPSLRSRFVLEAEINGNLEHPGIVPVYGLGRHPDGRPFYAMRFVEGDSLAEAVERFHAEGGAGERKDFGSLEFRQLLGRFVDVCEAIAYAHSRGVLHRDLKPANVMLGKYGETLVVDWGLAKATGRGAEPAGGGDDEVVGALVPPSGDSRDATQAGSALGTPQYMSPEQAEGRVDELGPATDVYALGATLYAVLTGRPPVAGRTSAEVLARVVRGEIIPPRQARADVPRALEAVCQKAMAREASARYGGALELARDVERWLADEPVSALPEPLLDHARRWTRKHRTLATTAGALLVAGLIGATGFAAVMGAKNRELDRKNDALDRANAELVARNRDLQAANEATRQAEQLADRRLDSAMAAIKDYYSGFAQEALQGGQIPAALKERLLERPRRFYEELTRELEEKEAPSLRERSLLAEGRGDLGKILLVLGRRDEARREFERGIALAEALVAEHPETRSYRHGLAMMNGNMGVVLRDEGKAEAARAALEEAVAMHEALVAEAPEEMVHRDGLGISLGTLGVVLSALGDHAGAERAYRRAIENYASAAEREPDGPAWLSGLARGYTNLGFGRHFAGDAAGARDALRTATAHFERLAALQPDVPDYLSGLARSHSNLGAVLQHAGEADEARAEYERSLEVHERLVTEHPSVPEYRYGLMTLAMNMGILRQGSGETDAAEAAYRRALEVGESLVAAQPRAVDFRAGLSKVHLHYAQALMARGEADRARAEYEAALEGTDELVGAHPGLTTFRDDVAKAHAGRGLILGNGGDFAGMLEALRRAEALAAPGGPTAAALPALMQQAEVGLAAGERLAAALEGREPPRDDAERLTLGQLAYGRGRHAAAARFWGEALDADPSLGDDRGAQHRYNAACAAALAAAGAGRDEPAPDEAERARLRGRARAWLESELEAWKAVADGGDATARALAAQTLRHWTRDGDLASVRGEGIVDLPEGERAGWTELWGRVDRDLRALGGK